MGNHSVLFSVDVSSQNEMCRGEMFDYIVEHRHVSELQACKFFHQIVDGTEVLHKNEITHRDLKPENLLLKNSPDGWIVKIVDFGLSNTHEVCSQCNKCQKVKSNKRFKGWEIFDHGLWLPMLRSTRNDCWS